jgi:hypothetical protein
MVSVYTVNTFLRAAQKFLHFYIFLCNPAVTKLENHIGVGTMDHKESRIPPIGKKEGRKVIWQRTPVKIISLLCFYLHHVVNGKDDNSSEAHLYNSTPSRGSYLGCELCFFSKYFNFNS